MNLLDHDATIEEHHVPESNTTMEAVSFPLRAQENEDARRSLFFSTCTAQLENASTWNWPLASVYPETHLTTSNCQKEDPCISNRMLPNV